LYRRAGKTAVWLKKKTLVSETVYDVIIVITATTTTTTTTVVYKKTPHVVSHTHAHVACTGIIILYTDRERTKNKNKRQPSGGRFNLIAKTVQRTAHTHTHTTYAHTRHTQSSRRCNI